MRTQSIPIRRRQAIMIEMMQVTPLPVHWLNDAAAADSKVSTFIRLLMRHLRALAISILVECTLLNTRTAEPSILLLAVIDLGIAD